MKFAPATDKYECLFQGFYLLFGCPTAADQDEVGRMISIMLMDPDITQKHAQQACDRAVTAHLNEKKLEATFNG
jgi:hypothetical protein|tara:strand:+ start:3045 stop:3266 length:222 start_codon:yes stop_codon:yes gene_type:complete